MEFHKIYVDDLQKSVMMDLSAELDVKNFSHYHDKESEEHFILQYEFGKWMIEGIFIIFIYAFICLFI